MNPSLENFLQDATVSATTRDRGTRRQDKPDIHPLAAVFHCLEEIRRADEGMARNPIGSESRAHAACMFRSNIIFIMANLSKIHTILDDVDDYITMADSPFESQRRTRKRPGRRDAASAD